MNALSRRSAAHMRWTCSMHGENEHSMPPGFSTRRALSHAFSGAGRS